MRRGVCWAVLVGAILAGLAELAGCRCSPAAAGAAAHAAPAGAVAGLGARRSSAMAPPPALAVRRGDLRPRLLLSGELEAARAQALSVPQSPAFQLQIRWLAEDGGKVAAGAPVVELDNSAFVTTLEEQRLAVATAADDLARMQAEAGAARAEKEFAVEQARTDLAKARIAAAVPVELLPRRDWQDHQLKLRQAEAALAKAAADLEAQRAKVAADLAVQRIVLDKAHREVAASEAAIRELVLRADRDSVVVVGDHPLEKRKFQPGDTVWTGMTIATLPVMSSLEVAAALSDVDDGRVVPGMPATCVLDADPGIAYAGRVVEVSGVARESRRTALLRSFAVRIALDPGGLRQARRLRPGMSVRVEIAAAPVRAALLVPRAALDLAGTPPRALLAGGGAAPVRLGPCDAFWCVAESGVGEGEALRLRAAAAGGHAEPAGPAASAAPAGPAVRWAG